VVCVCEREREVGVKEPPRSLIIISPKKNTFLNGFTIENGFMVLLIFLFKKFFLIFLIDSKYIDLRGK
jgi:hypothetical protein